MNFLVTIFNSVNGRYETFEVHFSKAECDGCSMASMIVRATNHANQIVEIIRSEREIIDIDIIGIEVI